MKERYLAEQINEVLLELTKIAEDLPPAYRCAAEELNKLYHEAHQGEYVANLYMSETLRTPILQEKAFLEGVLQGRSANSSNLCPYPTMLSGNDPLMGLLAAKWAVGFSHGRAELIAGKVKIAKDYELVRPAVRLEHGAGAVISDLRGLYPDFDESFQVALGMLTRCDALKDPSRTLYSLPMGNTPPLKITWRFFNQEVLITGISVDNRATR